ncbi:MAG: hypothetical protein ACRD2L_12265, partial [Terriglobia bacterium]
MKFITRADDRLKSWRKLGKEQADKLGKFLIELNNWETWPTPDQFADLAEKHGLSQEAFETYKKVREDFQDILKVVEETMVEEARHGIQDADTRAARLVDIAGDFQRMRASPYFPLSRFGSFTVAVRALGPFAHEGKIYKVGDIVTLETFDNEQDRDRRFVEAQKEFSGQTVTAGYISQEMRYSFQGLPPGFLEMLRDRLVLSPDQTAMLDEIAYLSLPGRAFKHHFRKREKVPGFSMDAERSYANYFFHAANHVARIKHAREFEDAINLLDKDIKERNARLPGSDTTKRTQLYDHLLRHYKYIRDPENE